MQMQIALGKSANFWRVTNPCVPAQHLVGAEKEYGNTYKVERNLCNAYLLTRLNDVAPKSVIVSAQTRACVLEDSMLYDYQKRDILRMISQPYIMNANPMGYGKTLETVVTLRESGVSNVLVIAPKSVLLHWERELTTHWADCPDIFLLRSGKTYAPGALRSGIIIVNYEMLRNDAIRLALQGVHWGALVLDESHRIKNRKTQVCKAVTALHARRKIFLTGTPLLNRVADLFSQLHALHASYVGKSYWRFVEAFTDVQTDFMGHQVVGELTKNTQKRELLKWLISQVAVRNNELALTPGKRQTVVTVQMDKDQKKLYQATKKVLLRELPENLTVTCVLTHLLRLRQVTSSPEQFSPSCSNAKLEWLVAQVEDNPSTKFVVFSCFTETLRWISKALGQRVRLYIGDMSAEARDSTIDAFNDPAQNIQVLAGTIDALGTGVNGLQNSCNTVVFMDSAWNPGANAQAEDRLNRIGQTQAVHVYYLECDNTFDQHVASVNQSKSWDIDFLLDVIGREGTDNDF
jgi:SNF2 family DNA or RNA helicase